MRQENIELSNYFAELIKESSFLFFISYKGMDVAQFEGLRNLLFDNGVGCHVIKNSFTKIGLKNADIELPDDYKLVGDTALIYGSGDPGPTAKLIKGFKVDVEFISFKAAVIDGNFLTATDAALIADLPSREILLSQLLGVLQAPMGNLVGVLNAKAASIVYVLQSYLDKKEKSS